MKYLSYMRPNYPFPVQRAVALAVFLCAVAISPLTPGRATAQQPPADVAPQYDLSNPAEHWPWGFGKNGMPGEPAEYDHVLYVDNVAENGNGSAEKPFSNLASATKRAGALMQSMEMTSMPEAGASIPVWLKIIRKGDQFLMQTAPDVDGTPGQWENVNEGREIAMPDTFYAGLLTYTTRGWR